jgi:hypothetical protein
MTAKTGRPAPSGWLGVLALLAAGLGGCGDYDPPVAADHESAGYQADLTACQQSGGDQADRRAKATFPMFATYPISWPIEQRVLISRCMAAKGYKDRS